jgi:hypothetical protein
MVNRRLVFVLLLALLSLIFAACVPETDLERAAGGRGNDPAADLTPIPEDGLLEVDELQLRVLSIEIRRRGGRVSAEIAIAGGPRDDIRLADTARVEWSDGEITNALPRPGANIVIDGSRNDPDGTLEPVRVYLSNVTRFVGTDEDAEFTIDGIVTQWGTFPILEIDRGSRPPGWKVAYQAAGQRWVTEARVFQNGRVRYGDVEGLSFNDDFAPVSATLRFGTEIEDFEDALPLRAEVDIRYAVPEIAVDL